MPPTDPLTRQQQAAHMAVRAAVRDGEMPRPDALFCASCGHTAAHYHHYRGYARKFWLVVQPLCHTCHGAAHRSQPPPPTTRRRPLRGTPDLIGLRQAAEATGVKRRTLAYAAGEQHLQAWYIGNQWLTTLAAVERWREHGKHTPGPAKGSKRRQRQEERDDG